MGKDETVILYKVRFRQDRPPYTIEMCKAVATKGSAKFYWVEGDPLHVPYDAITEEPCPPWSLTQRGARVKFHRKYKRMYDELSPQVEKARVAITAAGKMQEDLDGEG